MTNPTPHMSTEAGGPAMPDQGKFHYYDQPPRFTVNLRVSGTASLTIAAETHEEARAQVAAAYGSAADALQNVAENWDCGHNESRLCDCARDAEQRGLAADEVRSMAPAHAQAALEAYGREKVLEGMQRAAALFPLGSRDGGIISSAILAEMETLK